MDDDPTVLRVIQGSLRHHAYDVILAGDGQAAYDLLQSRDVDLIITDINMPRLGGFEFLERIRRSGRDIDVVILTGEATLETAVRAVRLGVVDFLEKPLSIEYFTARVAEILQRRLLRLEHRRLRSRDALAAPLVIGGSKAMNDLRSRLRRVAASDETVLIRGESGTGKELVARTIHAWSPRHGEPFLPVDCSSLTPSVIESELFGHEKGAFTGAIGAHSGLLRAAGRGTIFLDEIGELTLDLQPKLLRALQEREVRPVGSARSIPFEGRILAATNRELEPAVREGRFREDLFWRLNVLPVRLPPLRERREDIPELTRHFLSKHGTDSPPPALGPELIAALELYDWPGNVRELENCVRRILVLDPDSLKLEEVLPAKSAPAHSASPERSLAEWEKTAVRSALASSGGNVREAARRLGVSKTTLYRKMKEYGLLPTA